MTIEQILEIIERYKLRIPPTVYYDLLADIREAEEEQKPIKALGEELRKVREGIKDGIVLYGYDKAVAICNKYLSETEDT